MTDREKHIAMLTRAGIPYAEELSLWSQDGATSVYTGDYRDLPLAPMEDGSPGCFTETVFTKMGDLMAMYSWSTSVKAGLSSSNSSAGGDGYR
jgi:hypothetical protein